MGELDEAREEIARYLYYRGKTTDTSNLDYISKWNEVPELVKVALRREADDILSRKGDNWRVRLVKRNGELPTQHGRVAYERLLAVLKDHKIDEGLLDGTVGEVQIDMLKANFRQVIE